MHIAFRIFATAAVTGILYGVAYSQGRLAERCSWLNGKGVKA